MKIFLRVLGLLLASILVACGGGGGSGGSTPTKTSLVISAGDKVVIPAGSFKEYSITGGVPPYQAASSESAIAVASVSGAKLSVGAISGGTATVRVYDYAGTMVSTQVTVGSSVPLYTSAPSTINLKPAVASESCSSGTSVASAERAVYSISGGSAPYKVSSSNTSVVTVSMTDAAHWQAVAMGFGQATVRITDSAGASLTVDFANLSGSATTLAVTPTDLTMPTGYEAVVTVTGGTKPYRAAGGIPAAIQVLPACSDDGKFTIKGNLASTLDIGFVDAGGQSVKVKVTINTATVSFRMSPSPIVISETGNDSITFGLYGFYGDTGTAANSGSVCIYVSDPTFFALDSSRAQCSTYSATARTFTLNTGSRGNRCVSADTTITVQAVDQLQQVATGTITIQDNGTGCNNGGGLTVSPSSLTVGPGVGSDVQIRGGSGSYSVSTLNARIALASLSGNVVTVTGGTTAGTTSILVTDSATGATATITVTNSTGSSGGGGSGGTFAVSPSTLTVSPGGSNAAAILNGSGSYVATSSAPGIATAAISGSTVTVTGGNTTGSATITLTDVTTGSTASITVTNAAGAGSVRVSPSILYTVTDQDTTAVISGGSGTYGVSAVNGAIVKSASVSGSVASFTGGDFAGSVTAMVYDLNTGASASLLIVNNASSALTATPSTVPSLGIGATQSVTIGGGSGSYTVSSANTAIATATISGGTVTITGVTVGATSVTVTDTTTGRSVVIGVSVI